VTGRLLVNRGLRLGVFDTLTGGSLAESLIESGYGAQLVTNLYPASLDDVWPLIENHQPASSSANDLAAAAAASVAPEHGLGLALLGPFEDNSTVIALHGLEKLLLTQPGRRFQDSPYLRRWFVIQGLDWIRRALLGQLASPADWN
jgi:hypothetical protein